METNNDGMTRKEKMKSAFRTDGWESASIREFACAILTMIPSDYYSSELEQDLYDVADELFKERITHKVME